MARTGLFVALLLVGVGCGGGDPCAGSPCPNDARPTAKQYQDCVSQHQSSMNNKCYQPTLAYEQCTRQNTVCNSSGSTDGSASASAISNNCKAAFDAALCCSIGFSCK